MTALATGPLPPAGCRQVPDRPPPPRSLPRLARSALATASPSLPAAAGEGGKGRRSLRSLAPPPHAEPPSPAAADLRPPAPAARFIDPSGGPKGLGLGGGGHRGMHDYPQPRVLERTDPLLIFPQSGGPQCTHSSGFSSTCTIV